MQRNHFNRRMFAKLAGLAVAARSVRSAEGESKKTISLFNGRTLDGWIQIENSATSLSSGGITDPYAFAAKLARGSDPVSAFLREQLEDSVKGDLAAYSASNANAKTMISALVKSLNRILSGPSTYDKARFDNVALRPETEALLKQNVQGRELARLNKLLLEDAYPAELAKCATTGWIVKTALCRAPGRAAASSTRRTIAAVTACCSRCGMSRAIPTIKPACSFSVRVRSPAKSRSMRSAEFNSRFPKAATGTIVRA
jgi:hypothetical protein